MHKTLATFSDLNTPPVFDFPRPERLVAGNPQRATWTRFERDGMSAGLWGCEPGAWRIAFGDDTDEFFHVLSGRIRITDEAAAPLVAAGVEPSIDTATLDTAGARPLRGGDLIAKPATLVDLVTPDAQTEYWLGFRNFYAITRYNRSYFYAMAVYQLSQELRQG